MKMVIKKIGLTNQTFKILSICFGYLLWLIFVQTQKINLNMKVPLYFYGLKENYEINAPENVNVNILAKRSDVKNMLLEKTTSTHIDLTKFEPGQHNINLTDNAFFLHDKIKLIEYSPSSFSILIKEKK